MSTTSTETDADRTIGPDDRGTTATAPTADATGGADASGEAGKGYGIAVGAGLPGADTGAGAPEWGRRDPNRPDGVTESLLVRAHPGLCEAWGQCHKWAPDVYPLDEEGYIDIHVLEVPPELAQVAYDGAKACPIGVISIVDVVVRPEHEHLRPSGPGHGADGSDEE